MNSENLRTADITLSECLHTVAVLASKSQCFVDEIPEVLQDDFKAFIVGKTLSLEEDRIITYDVMQYYKKIISKGFDYPIQFPSKSSIQKFKKEQKNNMNWFNEYQKVESFLENILGEKYVEMDFSKCKLASEATILMIKEVLNKKK